MRKTPDWDKLLTRLVALVGVVKTIVDIIRHP
jgi:hypothetical protein